jgi:hypothetical protein
LARCGAAWDATLEDTPPPEWQGTLLPLTIDGSLIQETVLFHVPSGSLISADLVENIHIAPHLPTRWFLKLGGIFGKVGWHRLYRIAYRDRAKARASVDRILDLPIERIVLAHGDIVEHDAREKLRHAMRWL